MGRWIRSSLARCLAVLVTPLLVLGVMAGMAPASAASSLSHVVGGRTPADAAAPAAAPASLRAAIGQSLGVSVSAAGYSRQAELTASGGSPGDAFGGSVALSARGTTALVGADFRHSLTGAAYVFTRRGGTWSQTATLTAAHGAPLDQFGSSVALSARGTTAPVGAPSFNPGAGAAYVFTLRGGTWSQTATLTAARRAPFDDFGASVALSARGSTALVGADLRNSGAGAAYVFTRRGGTWSQTAELTAAHEVRDDFFGASVALSAQGSTVLIGALGRKTGAAYVFRRRGGTWSQTATLTAAHPAPEEQFGSAVALSPLGSTALVGAPEPPGALTGSGHPGPGAAYLFTLRGGTWSQTAKLTTPHPAADDQFGASVALSARGSTALIGEPGNLSTAGAAYVFTLRAAPGPRPPSSPPATRRRGTSSAAPWRCPRRAARPWSGRSGTTWPSGPPSCSLEAAAPSRTRAGRPARPTSGRPPGPRRPLDAGGGDRLSTEANVCLYSRTSSSGR